MTDWLQTHASRKAVSEVALRSSRMELMEYVVEELVTELKDHLVTRVGWRREDLSKWPAPEIVLVVTDSHRDFFTRGLKMVRAECRALVLLHPNPMPIFHSFTTKQWRKKNESV